MKLQWVFLFIYMLHKNKWINHYVIQIYQILWKTKYFNTVKEGSIKYVLLIKEFGIPDDYRYDETSSCSGKMPSKLKKIILIESNK